MAGYSLPIQVRWADIDMNGHLRHSAYLDYGALVRTRFLSENGLPSDAMMQLRIGPIVFREQVFYKREIRLEDSLSGTMELTRARADFSRWSIEHHLVRADGVLAAVIDLDGAWLDLDKRKLAATPASVQEVFQKIPRHKDFLFTE